MTPPADRLRKHPLAFAGAIGVLALLTLLFFHRPLFGGGILVDYDLFTYFYPYRDLVGRAFAEGRFPLWNPNIFFGAPLFANVQSAVLYPLNLMTWWMEPPQQVILSAVVHTIIAGILAWALGLFGFRLRMASSLGLGIAYMFSGFMAQQVGHINQLNASAWLPGMMLMLLIATRRRSVLAIAAGAVFASFQFLAGHTQEFYLSGIVLAVTALLLVSRSIVTSGRYRRAKANGVPWIRSSLKVIVARPGIILWPAAALALMFGVGLALSGVQLLPTLELSSIGARAGGLSFNEGRTFSLPPWFLIWALLPGYIENPFSEFTAYVGVSGMALAVLGLVTSPRRWTRNLAALLVLLGLLFAIGGFNPLFEPLFNVVPGLNLFRVPARWLFVYTMGASILIGLGIEQILHARRLHRSRPWRRTLWGRILSRRSYRSVLAGVGAGAGVVIVNYGIFSVLPPTPIVAIWYAGLPALAVLLLALRPAAAGTTLGLVVVGVLAADLFLASRELPYNQITSPEAYRMVRPTITQLASEPGTFRTLTIADDRLQPGDEARINEVFSPAFDPWAVHNLIASLKLKDVLASNVSMAYGLQTVDGYDGGVLPLGRYLLFKQRLLESGGLNQETLVTTDPAQPDGFTRRQLQELPEPDLLSALNIRYIVADKRSDVWVDDVYYDLTLWSRIWQGTSFTLATFPEFEATTLGLITHLRFAKDLEDGLPIAVLTITLRDGPTITRDLLVGRDTAEADLSQPDIKHQAPQPVATWRGYPEGKHYLTKIDLGEPAMIESITLESLAEEAEFHLRGAALIDERTGRSIPVSINGLFSAVSSGDVKIYKLAGALERAFLVEHWSFAGGEQEAFGKIRTDLRVTAVVEADIAPPEADRPQPWSQDRPAAVVVDRYEPERIELSLTARTRSLLVVTDTFYPGWKAFVDGRAVPIYMTNILFRGIEIEPGVHRVIMVYEPDSLAAGIRLSLLGAAALLILLTVAGYRWLIGHTQRTPLDRSTLR